MYKDKLVRPTGIKASTKRVLKQPVLLNVVIYRFLVGVSVCEGGQGRLGDGHWTPHSHTHTHTHKHTHTHTQTRSSVVSVARPFNVVRGASQETKVLLQQQSDTTVNDEITVRKTCSRAGSVQRNGNG